MSGVHTLYTLCYQVIWHSAEVMEFHYDLEVLSRRDAT